MLPWEWLLMWLSYLFMLYSPITQAHITLFLVHIAFAHCLHLIIQQVWLWSKPHYPTDEITNEPGRFNVGKCEHSDIVVCGSSDNKRPLNSGLQPKTLSSLSTPSNFGPSELTAICLVLLCPGQRDSSQVSFFCNRILN